MFSPVILKGTLHSKLTLDFLAGLKVCIFGKNFTVKYSLDWCRRYLDILGWNVLKDADV